MHRRKFPKRMSPLLLMHPSNLHYFQLNSWLLAVSRGCDCAVWRDRNAANGLREELRLPLINFDVNVGIDSKTGNHFHVIDNNYLLGYALIPLCWFCIIIFSHFHAKRTLLCVWSIALVMLHEVQTEELHAM